MEELISVIIPIYNTEKYLDKCLESVINQTYQNLEIVLVNDGSTDGSGAICDEYAKRDSRIKVIHKENGGVSSARNKALEIANGEYVGFVDSDDSIELNMYENLLTFLIENEADLAICNQVIVTEQGKKRSSRIDECLIIDKKRALEEVLLSRAFCGGPCNKLFKKSICIDLRFPEDIFFGEDLVFVVQAIKNAKTVALIPDVYYNYYERSESATKTKFSDKRYSDVFARKRVFELVEQEKDFELTELAHVSIILADLTMLQQLGYDKEAQKKYCKKIQRSVIENFKLKRLKYFSTTLKLEVIMVCISYKLFFVLENMKNLVRKIIKSR